MENEQIWRATLGELELVLSKAHFTTWFKDTFIVSIETPEIVIGVPNAFTKEWLSNKYHSKIIDVLKKLCPGVEAISYKISPKNLTGIKKNDILVERAGNAAIPASASRSNMGSSTLNKSYTFENFIVSNTNRLAHASSAAVAANPGRVYNPLFIYGGVGLGKTHLIQAIGNEILGKDPGKKVVYLPCENFTNEFIHSISTGKINEFKKTYRNVDVLLVDDIQFLSNKEGFQEEFFHTFNSLHQTNHQIVMTADRMPKAIPALEDRLSSRFGWGLIADIQLPNFETRLAILQTKCQQKSFEVDIEILEYIAQNISSNIRELEGSLNRLITAHELENYVLNIKNVKHILADFTNNQQSANLSATKILKVVSDYYGVKVEEILSDKRNKELVHPRQVVMYVMRNEMNLSYPKIARELNGKDHTTIMYGFGKIKKELNRDEELRKDLISIKEKIYSI